MSYKYYIDFGSGFQEVSANAEGVSLVRKKDADKIYSKDTVEGDIKFYSTAHNLLLSASATKKDLPFKITYNAVEIYSGVIDLGGTYNVRERVSELKVVSIDPFKKMEDGLNSKYDMYERGVTGIDSLQYTVINYSELPFVYTGLPDMSKVVYTTRLDLLLKYLFSKIDDTILFDSDSFKYLDDSTYWQRLSVCSTASGYNGLITGNCDVALQDIFTFFAENIEMYPTLELIGSDYYFRFKHISEVIFTVGTGSQYNLTTYNGVNWSLNHQRYSFDNADRFWKIRRSNFATITDFVGADIVFTQLENVGNIKEVKNLIVTDVEGMFADPDNYPIDSGTLLMLATEEVATLGDIFLASFALPLSTPYVVNFTPGSPEVVEIISSGIGGCSIVSNFTTLDVGYIYKFGFDVEITGLVNSVRLRWDYTHQTDLFDFTASQTGIETDVVPFAASCRLIIDIETFGIGTIKITSTADTLLQRSAFARGLKATGILRGDVKYNMPLAQSYLDSIAGVYNKYSTPALINNVSTPVTLRKIKDVDNISVNMRSLLINFDYLVASELGNIEPTELKIDLNKGIAEFKGKI